MSRGLHSRTLRLALFVSLGVFLAACGSSNSGSRVSPTTTPAKTAQAAQGVQGVQPTASSPTPASAAASPVAAKAAVQPKVPDVYKVGDTIKVQDHTLSVLSADRDGDKLKLEVQINNTGSKELSVSSIISFSAKTSAGERLGYSFAAGGGQLDGKVLPNDKLKGTLSYRVPPDAKGLKLYYTPSLMGQSAIIVALDDEAAKTPFPRPAELSDPKPFAKGTTYKVGDAVSNKDVVATLTSAKLEGPALTASITIYNGGQKDVSISSVLSFDAKDGEGAKASFKMADGPSLDGELVPGDTLKGALAWEFAAPAPSGVKVYYQDSLFGGDTIVWSVN